MENTINRLKPFTKWTGGKRQLLSELEALMPNSFNRYYEPFVGGGALLFDTLPKKATINDYNSDLYKAYTQIKENTNELIKMLTYHQEMNSREYYLSIRHMDREDKWNDLSDVTKAARLLYMLRVDFNGLYRVNSKNQFNVPYGTYKNPKIVDRDLLHDISNYFNKNDIKILNTDFENAVSKAKTGDFVYFDPPYAPISETSSFTGYTHKGFDLDEQIRLRNLFVELDKRGVYVMLSNSSVPFIHDLYKDYKKTTTIVGANRMINSKKSGRGKVDEVIITNYLN